MGMFFGLGLHTLMDGVALGASVAAEAYHSPFLGLAGLGTFLAVVLHKPLDAFAITSVMKKGGWTTSQQSLVNFVFSLACPVGAVLIYFGATYLSDNDTMLGWGLALSAGFFICISLADLLAGSRLSPPRPIEVDRRAAVRRRAGRGDRESAGARSRRARSRGACARGSKVGG